jgi:hypothetical protein
MPITAKASPDGDTHRRAAGRTDVTTLDADADS